MAWMRSGVRSPSAPLNTTVAFVVAVLALLGGGCSKSSPSNPAKDAAQREPAADASTSTASTAAGGTAAGTASPGSPSSGAATSCTSDDDCRTWSSYCREAPCVCRVYAKNEAEPHCSSSAGNVTCFVDPCMKKAAACQDGRCVLVMQSNQ